MHRVSTDYQQSLTDILQRTNSSRIDIAVDVYGLILQQENQVEALHFFLEEAEDVEMMQEQQDSHHFSQEELENLKKRYDKLVEGIISNLVSQKLDQQCFYSKLWDALQNNPLISSEKEKGYVFYRVWTEEMIPYFQIDDGLQMDNEKFHEICQKRRIEIRKAFFVLASSLKQRTETSSLIMQILDSCEAQEEKAAVLAQVIAFVERRMLLMMLGKRDNEQETEDN